MTNEAPPSPKTSPFDHPDIRDWFFRTQSEAQSALPTEVVTTGAGPFGENDFDGFLRTIGRIQVRNPHPDINALIVGCDDWDPSVIARQLDFRRGKELFVYSQEMFLASLMSPARDPHRMRSTMILRQYADHPPLQEIEAWGFDWTKSAVVPRHSAAEMDRADRPTVGLLEHQGYRIGRSGPAARRKILECVFASSIPKVGTRSQVREWGAPGSSQRLQKLANSIADLVLVAKKKKSTRWERSISSWQSDLGWLKSEFYRGRFHFDWPTTRLRRQVHAPEVVLFSKSWCPECKTLKAQLKKAGVAFNVADVDEPTGGRLSDKLGVAYVPAVFIRKGTNHIRVRTPSVQSVRRALARHEG